MKCRELAIDVASKDVATRLADLADEFETLARDSEATKPKSPERTLH